MTGSAGNGAAGVVGTFDGVHRGHRFLIERLKETALERGLGTRVYTFASHPLASLAPGKAPLALLETDEKVARLMGAGADEVRVEDFAGICHLTAREYIERLARDGIKMLLVGHDNRFGSDRLTSIEEFRMAAAGTGVEITGAPELRTDDGHSISSSDIRRAIADGNIKAANEMLGYCYHFTGIVEHGKQLGRTIGFPTANLRPRDPQIILPGLGVYAGHVKTPEGDFPTMTNIGRRPTVDAPDAPVSVETHIIGLDRELYGSELTLYLYERIRGEERFASVDELREQLEADRQAVKSLHRSSQ